MEITLNLTAEEARKIIRSLERSRLHWSSAEMIRDHENTKRISNSYRDLAKNVREQIKEQGVEP